jgi:hypothetical protein
MNNYSSGSLVKARGREWVVLPDSTDDLHILRLVDGSGDEIAGIYLPLGTGPDFPGETFRVSIRIVWLEIGI